MRHSILKGIRILDFSWVLAGPFATRLLADFGAEVIKVQPPMPENENGISRGYQDNWNRNKLGISLDLSKTQGLEIAGELVKVSDAVVENFSPRVMENWGLNYPGLCRLKPDIILLSLSAMGQTGPWRDYIGFGPTLQAFSGLTALTAYPGGSPLGVGYSLSDHVAGLYGSLSLLSALEYRRKTGQGQHIDLSQLEAMSSLLSDAVLDFSSESENIKRSKDKVRQTAYGGVYPCRGEDRWCVISIGNEMEWSALKRAVGNPTWADDPKFSTQANRLQNSQVLANMISQWTSRHSAEQMTKILQREGLTAGMVQNARDLVLDEQLQHRKFFAPMEDVDNREIRTDANPIRRSDNEFCYRPAPGRGEDNDYVYRRLLGIAPEEIDRLHTEGVL
jgi:benzylsuccinate CoA-transferase BbsF subunit